MKAGAGGIAADGTGRAWMNGWRTGYWIVLALIVVSYVFCAAQSTANPSTAAFLVQLVTVAVTLRVAAAPPTLERVAWIVLVVAGVGALAVWITRSEGRVLDIVLSAASAVAFLAATIAIVAHQARRRGVDGEALLAAISAFVLVGMFYTFVYNLIGLVTEAPTFGAGVVDSLTRQLFFSFTTLTTIGYGNLVPETPVGQGVAVAEGITGQLFLVIAVARIIGGPRTRDDREGRRVTDASDTSGTSEPSATRESL